MFAHLILACSLFSIAPSADCGIIEDRDRRSFAELTPIFLDVDGDLKLDRISPRVYSLTSAPNRKRKSRAKETHWITFDLNTSSGMVLRSFFRYQYGTDEGNYWVYALVPCDVNKDGRTELVFYSGDDTSDETIVLLNRGGRFIVHSRKVSKSN
jgi:hypothetical protein